VVRLLVVRLPVFVQLPLLVVVGFLSPVLPVLLVCCLLALLLGVFVVLVLAPGLLLLLRLVVVFLAWLFFPLGFLFLLVGPWLLSVVVGFRFAPRLVSCRFLRRFLPTLGGLRPPTHPPPHKIMRIYQFLSFSESEILFNKLLNETSWEQKYKEFYGKNCKIPRLTAWHGSTPYTYSGIENKAQPWTETTTAIKDAIEEYTWLEFSSCLLNFYRDGSDSISWHSDDEPELGPDPIIACLSLGGPRKFQIRDKRTKERTDYELKSGSLLIMPPGFQRTHEHQIPKTKKPTKPRISLTFR
jgi:alkylated DNA repair dioxygenase AlkB